MYDPSKDGNVGGKLWISLLTAWARERNLSVGVSIFLYKSQLGTNQLIEVNSCEKNVF